MLRRFLEWQRRFSWAQLITMGALAIQVLTVLIVLVLLLLGYPKV